jgi:hypothetical protein
MPQSDAEFILLPLHPKEIALLLALRNKFRYGDVIIKMKDGLPQRLAKAYEFDELNTEAFDNF